LLLVATVSHAGPQVSDTGAMENHMRQVRSKAEQKMNSALGVILKMDEEQTRAFRPLRKEYDRELKKLGKLERGLVRDFSDSHKNLDAETATELGNRFFDLERQRLALQEEYLKAISEQVSPVVAVQFIQLQRKFETELALERMKYSPLAE
jgi:hypothetical protein